MSATKSLALVCKGVSKSYSNQSVFRQLNLDIPSRHLVITGANGCGKTTLLRLIAGIEEIDQGNISWHGHDVMSVETKKRVGMSANCIVFPEFLTVRQLVEFHCSQYACTFPQNLIDQIALSPFLGQKVGALSLGTAKKLSLVMAFAHSPDLLILDEPGNGLDEQAVATLASWLDTFDGNIILATHDHVFCQNLDAQYVDLTNIQSSQS
jgi:ABC-type multidrug transport system ATPase subunit